MTQLVSQSLLFAAAFLLLLALTASIYRRRRRLARMLHGRQAEARAPEILRDHGYRALIEQPDGQYTLSIDGQPQEISVRADLLARRGRTLALVEVKTGKAARPTLAETRRQLLEYALAFDVDELLLVDADQQTLQRISFPSPKHRAVGRLVVLGAVIGIAIGAVLRELWG
ncbi:MAG: hypothetical protein H6707_14295 [Deltaproteobacteria bacterium]|nr:hypothetical protein [Deltaproteobacteria bacterium]